MTLPWDDINIKQNLQVISTLQRGHKLSVVKSGATPGEPAFTGIGRGGRSLRAVFDRQRGITGFERKKKGETILNDHQYQIPLMMLFQKASMLWQTKGRPRVSKKELCDSWDGLLRMAQGYANNRSRTKREKMAAILDTVGVFIPNRTGIQLRGEMRIDLRRRVEFKGKFDESVYKWMVPKPSNTTGREEYEGSPALIRKIFGGPPVPVKSQRRGSMTFKKSPLSTTRSRRRSLPRSTRLSGTGRLPTKIPTLQGRMYKRKKMGVCKQFQLDITRTPKIKLNGEELDLTDESIGVIFNALGKDEALLFVVSQLGHQSGCEGLLSLVGAHKDFEKFSQDKIKCTFIVRGKKIMLGKQIAHTSIDTHPSGRVTITGVTELNPDEQGTMAFGSQYKMMDGPPDMVAGQPRDFGIDRLQLTCVMDVWRDKNCIRWQLMQAMLYFKEL